MNYNPYTLRLNQVMLGFLCLLFSISAYAEARPVTGPLNLTTVPLANATNTTVLPNLMFILDNSGSMRQDYTPDYMSDEFGTPGINERNCRDSGDDTSDDLAGDPHPWVGKGTATSTSATNSNARALDMCVIGDPPFMSPDMNTQYYDPEIRYIPGVNSDGESRDSQTDPTNVRTDSYNKQNSTQLKATTNFVNLTTQYPDRLWCDTNVSSDLNTTAKLAARCKQNIESDPVRGNYKYPDATYRYGRLSTNANPNQTVNSTMINAVIKTSGAPYYYKVETSEFCTGADLRVCTQSSDSTGAYTTAANSRWCKDTGLTDCQAVQNTNAGYVFPRYVGSASLGTAATTATGIIRITGSSNTNNSITSVVVNGVNIMSGTASNGTNSNANTRRNNLATSLATRINARGLYTATASNGNVTITAVASGTAGNGNFGVFTATSGVTFGSHSDPAGGADATPAAVISPPYKFKRIDIIPSNAPFAKASTRTDCVGETECTYAEEITNFANWYTYYRTRMQAMKSSASLAFKPIDTRYRVGYITIANQTTSGNYLAIDRFDPGAGKQKDLFYTRLFNATPSSSTPLREALALVGRLYAGKKPVGNSDPVQYACQQNFALLTTDGYWNGNAGVNIDNQPIGNYDDDSSQRPKYEGLTAASGTLSDVAKYYFDTDIRNEGNFGNCDGALDGVDVCGTPTEYPNQRMVTFTLGLGIDGTLLYTDDYKSATTGDFADIVAGTKNWPVPVADNATAIDDLWHAAVNGEGTYFSAKNPAQLTQGLNDALSQIEARIGAGAAAASSTLNPVANDNTAYVASYTSVKWTGNLEARSINTVTGRVNENALACVENVVRTPCPPPSFVDQPSNEPGGAVHYCVTPDVETAADCGSDNYDTDAKECRVQVQIGCEGTMQGTKGGTVVPKVGVTAEGEHFDTRNIKIKGTSGLQDFNLFNLTSIGLAGNFSKSFLMNNLSQWSTLTADQQENVTPENLIKFLRGQKLYENRSSNPEATRIFRLRETVLGDALESKPAFVGKPTFSYTDPGYLAFKEDNAERAGTVYIGTNDGMLHAFDSETLVERWAYIPSVVLPNLWKLADKNYATSHANFVNGDPIISDICVADCNDPAAAEWKTILVAGLNGGGRAFYALDITDPAEPKLMWEFTPANDGDLGYSYGQPVITKLANGTWVVLLTSGYNNIPDNNAFYNDPGVRNRQIPALFNSGSGDGFLYILNAVTGPQAMAKMPTNAGTVELPSGLGRITAYVEDAEKNNTALYVYGGDLLGNIWRFDINQPAAASVNPLKFATLYSDDDAQLPQPITARMELGQINGKRVVFAGTGKYLQIGDLDDTQVQSVYAIKDADVSSTLINPRNFLTQQVFDEPLDDIRTMDSPQPVDFVGGRGWFVDLPDDGERQTVAGQLILGTLVFPTTVPSNTVCSPAGYGWLNFLDYKTGGPIDNDVSARTKAPIVGLNIFYIGGKPVVSAVTAADPTPRLIPGVDFASNAIGFQKKRVIWRELIPD